MYESALGMKKEGLFFMVARKFNKEIHQGI